METTRRSFLIGLFSAAIVARIPGTLPAAAETVDFNTWAPAIAKVYGEYLRDLMIYGTAAIRYKDEFPFVESIDLTRMSDRELSGAVTIQKGLPDLNEFSEARRLISDELGRRATARLLAEDKARRINFGDR